MIAVVPGFLVAAAIGLAIVLRVTRHGRARLDGHPWLLAETAKLHVGIMGGLAGFSFTGIVLVIADMQVTMVALAFLWLAVIGII
jgi:hypothetical protein